MYHSNATVYHDFAYAVYKNSPLARLAATMLLFFVIWEHQIFTGTIKSIIWSDHLHTFRKKKSDCMMEI